MSRGTYEIKDGLIHQVSLTRIDILSTIIFILDPTLFYLLYHMFSIGRLTPATMRSTPVVQSPLGRIGSLSLPCELRSFVDTNPRQNKLTNI